MASNNAIFALVITSSLVGLLSHAHDGESVKYGYGGSTGPDSWGTLSPEFKRCLEGRRQSPINIVKNKAVLNATLGSFDRHYKNGNATLIYNGKVTLKFEENIGAVLVDGKNYTLDQVHWHSPSEHTIDGERFPLEMHIVHEGDDGNLAVVAILYQYGSPDPFLFQLKDKFAALAAEKCGHDEDAHIPAGVVYTRSLSKRTRKYYRYSGSLTTPPCTENVVWTIFGKVREMTKEQAAAILAPMDEAHRINARPAQQLNGRTVEVYDMSKIKDEN